MTNTLETSLALDLPLQLQASWTPEAGYLKANLLPTGSPREHRSATCTVGMQPGLEISSEAHIVQCASTNWGLKVQ